MFLFESSESTIEMSIFVSNFIGEDMWDFWNVSLFYLQGFSFTFLEHFGTFMKFLYVLSKNLINFSTKII